MNGVHAEGGEADGEVFGTFITGRAVAHPFTRVRDDALTGGHFERAADMLDTKRK